MKTIYLALLIFCLIIPSQGDAVVGLIVHDDNDSDVEGATITIVGSPNQEAAVMPPVVREKGDGLYTVANLNLQREGSWELRK